MRITAVKSQHPLGGPRCYWSEDQGFDPDPSSLAAAGRLQTARRAAPQSPAGFRAGWISQPEEGGSLRADCSRRKADHVGHFQATARATERPHLRFIRERGVAAAVECRHAVGVARARRQAAVQELRPFLADAPRYGELPPALGAFEAEADFEDAIVSTFQPDLRAGKRFPSELLPASWIFTRPSGALMDAS